MDLFDKIKWILGILIVFTLVITTNMVDRSNFSQMNDAVESIYEDRLVVKDLIYKISDNIHQKEVAALKSDTGFYVKQNQQLNNEIETHLISFSQTKLTNREEQFLNNFRKDFTELKENEEAFIQSNYSQNTDLFNQFQIIKRDLNNLAEIQLREGSKQFEKSRRAMDTVDLFTQIEIYLLIFLAIVIQIIVIYSPKKDS
jgi:hypothetical protein